MNVAVAGTGYVGLVTAVCLADKGHTVTCVDIDQEKIDALKLTGKSLLYEKDLDELLRRNQERLSFTTQYMTAYANADVIFIGVGTPEKSDGSADLSQVYTVARQIAESVEKDCVVVVKSTVPIGTNEKVESILQQYKKKDVVLSVVSNPEFLSQGTAVRDTLYAARIVIGVNDKKAEAMMLQLYKDFDVPKIVTDRRSAEMIKYASNDFLALKISYINEIANLCEKVGGNIEDITRAMGLDPRIGSDFLRAGVGYGGSCFPKDTKALHWLANFHDHELKTVKAAIEVNENQKLKLIKKARKYYESFEGLTIAVLGLTFKPGTDDLREAPSLISIPILLEDGAKVKVYDVVGERNFQKRFGNQVSYCKTVTEALYGADLCFIFTEWPEIKECQAEIFKRHMKTPIVIDGRNCYDLDSMRGKGIVYESIGRETVKE
jgi:UDPglucose 6-dehydrogenase